MEQSTSIETLFANLSDRIAKSLDAYDSEAWRREFIIGPVLTSPYGLDFRPWDMACEVSFRLDDISRGAIREQFGKDRRRVRPDYIVFPKAPELVQLVVEAKTKHESNALFEQHEKQVLVEQLITNAPWAVLTDGEAWFLFFQGHPIYCCNTLQELKAQMPAWASLIGREALIRQAEAPPDLLQLLLANDSPFNGAEPAAIVVTELAQWFPRLQVNGFRVLAPPSSDYNNWAAAVGDRGRWWWPNEPGFWPGGAPRDLTIHGFRETFELLGFRECTHPALEAGVDKLCIFSKGQEPTHAARQTREGLWRSKLGRTYEILHDLHALEGQAYGEPSLVLCRKPRDLCQLQPAPQCSVGDDTPPVT